MQVDCGLLLLLVVLLRLLVVVVANDDEDGDEGDGDDDGNEGDGDDEDVVAQVLVPPPVLLALSGCVSAANGSHKCSVSSKYQKNLMEAAVWWCSGVGNE